MPYLSALEVLYKSAFTFTFTLPTYFYAMFFFISDGLALTVEYAIMHAV